MCLPLETTRRKRQSLWSISIKVGINGKTGTVEAAIIRGPAPLLLSRNTMRSLTASLDFGQGTLTLGDGSSQQLQVNAAGQYVISILDFP